MGRETLSVRLGVGFSPVVWDFLQWHMGATGCDIWEECVCKCVRHCLSEGTSTIEIAPEMTQHVRVHIPWREIGGGVISSLAQITRSHRVILKHGEHDDHRALGY